MQITEIKQIGKSENYKIFLQGNFALVLNGQTIFQNKLCKGFEIEKDKLEQMQFDSEKIIAFDKAISLLSKSSKTKRDMILYLKTKGYSKLICDYVVQKLSDYKYIDDKQYAFSYVEKVKNQKGKNLIKAMLISKGIDKEYIEEALQNLNQNQEIQSLCEKFMKNKDKTGQNKQKLHRHLISKGFSFDEVGKAVNVFFRGEKDDWN